VTVIPFHLKIMHMLRHLHQLLLLCCGLLAASCGGDPEPALPDLPRAEIVRNLKRDAAACRKAIVEKDYGAMARYTLPKLVKMVGGVAGLRHAGEKTMQDKDGNMMELQQCSLGEPGAVKKVDTQLLALVPQKMVIRAHGIRAQMNGWLLGISDNGGRNWVFIDTVKMREESFNRNFPELAGKIDLPPKPKPQILEEEASDLPVLSEEKMISNLHRDAAACGKALLDGDHVTMARFVPAKLLNMVGGPAGLGQAMKLALQDEDGNEMKMVEATYGDSGPIKKDGRRLLSLMPQQTVIKVPGGRVVKNGWLLAISENGGRTWVFLNTSEMRMDPFKKTFPELVGKIELPQEDEPRFEKD
jgi:hypothetical protein